MTPGESGSRWSGCSSHPPYVGSTSRLYPGTWDRIGAAVAGARASPIGPRHSTLVSMMLSGIRLLPHGLALGVALLAGSASAQPADVVRARQLLAEARTEAEKWSRSGSRQVHG